MSAPKDAPPLIDARGSALRAYKFLNSADIKYITDQETVRISSSIYFHRAYRSMEVKDETINDPNEGVLAAIQDREIRGGLSDDDRRKFKTMGIDFGNRVFTNSRFANNIVVQEAPNFHMFCAATGDLDKLLPVFCAPKSSPGRATYDACFECNDLAGLGAAIIKEGHIVGSDGEIERPASEYWNSITLKEVYYESLAQSFDLEKQADPFRKAEFFSDQREVRFVFNGTPHAPEVVIVKVPGLKKYFDEVDISEFLAKR